MINKFLLLMIVFVSLGFTQSNKILIKNVEVEGIERLTASDIIGISGLRKGNEIDVSDIQKSIKKLWRSERFGDIQIYLDEETIEGVSIRIIVKELPVLESIEFDGNKKVSSETLKESIDLRVGGLLSDSETFKATESVKAKYYENNYHNVEVELKTLDGTRTFSRKLKFIIKENKKLKVAEINFAQNINFTDSKLIRQFKETKPFKWYFPWRGKYDSVKFDGDKELLRTFYTSKGYYDFIIENENIEFSKEGININLDVYEGEKYYLRNVSWDGNTIHTDLELNRRLGFQKGDLFDYERFQIALSEQVTPLYMDEGYFFFDLNPDIIPIGKDSIDVNFNIVENNIVHVRKIIISGNDRTHENVIRRELKVYPGDIFNRKKLIDSYRDIIMLNYFETVVPNVIPINENQVDLTIDVVEKSADQAQFSMGYNGTYGFTGGGGVEFGNFRGRGQTLSVSYNRGIGGDEYSQTYTDNNLSSASYQSFSMSFVNPWVFDTPNLVGISLYYSERGQTSSYLPFDIHQFSASARWGRRFKWPDYFFRGSWMLKSSNNSYYSSSDNDLIDYFGDSIESSITTDDEGQSIFNTSGVLLTQIITRDSRNHPEFPSGGSKFEWHSTFSGNILGGDEDYHKHQIKFQWFTPTVGKLVLMHSTNMGVIKELPSLDGNRSVISPNARFYMGGTGMPSGEMLRGYEDNSIGPYSVSSYGSLRPRGGNVLLKYSAELRYPISESPMVYALLFAEVGNAWSEVSNIDPFNLKRSVGGGVRMYMPMIGMLGFDAGYGFDDNTGNGKPDGWRTHFIFGMPF
jgi:outer membrane protein insertion porin family